MEILSYNQRNVNLIRLAATCHMEVCDSLIQIENQLNQSRITIKGSQYLVPVLAQVLAHGGNHETIERLFLAFCPDGRKVLTRILNEGFLE